MVRKNRDRFAGVRINHIDQVLGPSSAKTSLVAVGVQGVEPDQTDRKTLDRILDEGGPRGEVTAR